YVNSSAHTTSFFSRDLILQVTESSDLVALSLTCRCLHSLVIPHIYNKFDIVCPEIAEPCDDSGVDALTYGLATLAACGPRGNNYAQWIRKFSLGNGPPDWASEYYITKSGGKMFGTLVNIALGKMPNLE